MKKPRVIVVPEGPVGDRIIAAAIDLVTKVRARKAKAGAA